MKISITPLDRVFSTYIRTKANWTCERCHTKYHLPTMALHNSHYHGRRKKSVRWEEDNCSALCHGCHLYFTSNPREHTLWMINKLGEKRYDLLTLKANLMSPVDKFQQIALTQYYTDKIKELKHGRC